jgi:hypothetical protein
LVVTVGLGESGLPVAAESAAPRYSGGEHSTKLVEIDSGATKDKWELRFSLNIAATKWSEEAGGMFTITLRRDGDKFTGAYAGEFQGKQRKGDLSGFFFADGMRRAGEDPLPKNELTRRCEQVIDVVTAVMITGTRRGHPQGGADVRRVTRALYQAASAVARELENAGLQ